VDQTVSCWGKLPYDEVPSPQPVTSLTGITELASGSFHVCSVGTNGSVHCWGSNTAGQLGNGTTSSSVSPVLVSGLSAPLRIMGRSQSSCAVSTLGEALCWGNGQTTPAVLKL
jgi:alpha-tubulin suppressor-like RCC1 family protein